MNSIEEKLWNYIDGACSAEERGQVSHLIQYDEEYKRTYNELLQVHNEINALELDEPPMAFTSKVMEQIRAQHANVPLKASVNKHIIWGIMIFLIGSILTLFVFALSHVGQSTGQSVLQLSREINIIHPEKYFTGTWLNGFLLFDMVLGLFLVDAYLRRHRQSSY